MFLVNGGRRIHCFTREIGHILELSLPAAWLEFLGVRTLTVCVFEEKSPVISMFGLQFMNYLCPMEEVGVAPWGIGSALWGKNFC